MTGVSPIETRRVCYRCYKPQITCICARVRQVLNRTKVWVLQHKRERFHAIGTARIAHLGLQNVQLEVLFEPREAAPATLASDAAVLYPGHGVRDLSSLEPHEVPSELVVLDGTWAHARTIYRDNTWLHGLPRYGLTPNSASNYRLRKEPKRECVSTIEAIVHALMLLEPDTPGLGGLLETFDSMIDDQLALISQRRSGKRMRAVPRKGDRVPRVFIDQPERVVAVYAEAARRVAHRSRDHRALVHWTAVRASSGEIFERFVQTRDGEGPTVHHLRHMGLGDEQMRAALPLEDVRAGWKAFSREDDVVVTWNQSTLDMMSYALTTPAESILLKSVYCAKNRGPCGTLDDVIAREQLQAPSLDVHGRAGRRLANQLALLAFFVGELRAQS